MNIHHLELFYYVAKHGGISQAARKMPYGIQQPAISAQLLQLENVLGVTLFRRRPFELTPSGKELNDFIRPFFDNLNQVGDKLRGTAGEHIRLGASEVVLEDYLPAILRRLHQRRPNLRFTLRNGHQADLEEWLQQQELDLAITILNEQLPSGLKSRVLVELPLVLLVPTNSKIKSPDALWKQDKITETLISLPSHEAVCRKFQQGLARLKHDWIGGLEVSSLRLVEKYVAEGYGIGLSVGIPKQKIPTGIRALPLTDFPQITIAGVWSGNASPIVEEMLQTTKAFVDEMT